MRGRDEKGEMKRLFTADYTLQTLFEVLLPYYAASRRRTIIALPID
jgi:hypothetical protein